MKRRRQEAARRQPQRSAPDSSSGCQPWPQPIAAGCGRSFDMCRTPTEAPAGRHPCQVAADKFDDCQLFYLAVFGNLLVVFICQLVFYSQTYEYVDNYNPSQNKMLSQYEYLRLKCVLWSGRTEAVFMACLRPCGIMMASSCFVSFLTLVLFVALPTSPNH